MLRSLHNFYSVARNSKIISPYNFMLIGSQNTLKKIGNLLLRQPAYMDGYSIAKCLQRFPQNFLIFLENFSKIFNLSWFCKPKKVKEDGFSARLSWTSCWSTEISMCVGSSEIKRPGGGPFWGMDHFPSTFARKYVGSAICHDAFFIRHF